MARYVSNMRPERAPIFAFTPSEHIYRQLALCWGTYPVSARIHGRSEQDDRGGDEISARRRALTQPNDNLVILSDLRAGDAQIDSIQVRQAKGGEPMEEPGSSRRRNR